MERTMAESAYLKVEKSAPGVVAVVLCEKIGEREAHILQPELSAAASSSQWKIALDCSRVTFLMSVGLGVLVSLNKDCKAGKGKMVLFGLSEPLMNLLKLTHLHKVFTIVPTRDAAAQAMS